MIGVMRTGPIKWVTFVHDKAHGISHRIFAAR